MGLGLGLGVGLGVGFGLGLGVGIANPNPSPSPNPNPNRGQVGPAPLSSLLLSSTFEHLGRGLVPLLPIALPPRAERLVGRLGVATRLDFEGRLQLPQAQPQP